MRVAPDIGRPSHRNAYLCLLAQHGGRAPLAPPADQREVEPQQDDALFALTQQARVPFQLLLIPQSLAVQECFGVAGGMLAALVIDDPAHAALVDERSIDRGLIEDALDETGHG